jgi:hypothetical protein
LFLSEFAGLGKIFFLNKATLAKEHTTCFKPPALHFPPRFKFWYQQNLNNYCIMKKKLLLLLLLFNFSAQLSWATHVTGAEISYANVAPFTYEVSLKVYSECGSAITPASATLQLSAPGCITGRTLILNQVDQKIKSLNGPALGSGCNPNYTSNSLVTTYSAILTFTNAEQTCPDWVLSWSECCRQAAGNLSGQDDLYTEAHLKLLPNLVNNSPRFDTINYPVSFVNLQQVIHISALAQDPDGDSLVYTSVFPLKSANQPYPYVPSGYGSGALINPNPLPPFNTLPAGTPGANPQVAVFPPAPGNYSPSWPLPSIHVNWTPGVSPVTVQPFFQFSTQTGSMIFLPAIFNNAGGVGRNRYALAILVEEYRKINGQPTKIGSVRREMFVEIKNFGPNNNPELSMVEMNGVYLEAGDLIELRPGATMNINLLGGDTDTADLVQMASNVDNILPGASLMQRGSKVISGVIKWTPVASDVREQPYYFNVVLKDNASPLRGYHERTIGVLVRQNGTVTGIKSAKTQATAFTAFPNPFTDQITFKLTQAAKAESIIIYTLLGQQIDEIQLKTVGFGEQKVPWQNAKKHAPGTYVARLITKDKTIQTLKFTKLQ